MHPENSRARSGTPAHLEFTTAVGDVRQNYEKWRSSSASQIILKKQYLGTVLILTKSGNLYKQLLLDYYDMLIGGLEN